MAVGVMTRVMVKGPMKRGASLGLVVRRGMSRVESHTFCPTLYWGAGRRWWSANLLTSMLWSRVRRALTQVLRTRRTRALAAGTPTSFSSSGKMGGWYPRQQANGDIPVEETGRLLYAYSTHGRETAQELEIPPQDSVATSPAPG